MITSRAQVIACQSLVSSNSMVVITIICFNTRKQYRYKGSVPIQENDTDIENQYEYRKIIQF